MTQGERDATTRSARFARHRRPDGSGRRDCYRDRQRGKRHAQNKAAEKEQAAANEVQEAAPPPVPVAPAPAPAPAAAAGDDLVSKLTELAKLRDSGVLSQEEFEQAKALVLNP
jgi:hypothetical protein